MNFLRSLVSGPRNRLKIDGVDLDLTYIDDEKRLIAMSFPASGIEIFIRNDINDVAKYLDSEFNENYMVYNLSERLFIKIIIIILLYITFIIL